MKYVKEGILGSYKEVAGGYSDPECTHVLLTLKEYDKIRGEKSAAVQDKVNAESWANKEVRAANDRADYQIKQAKKEIAQKMEELEGELAEAKRGIEYQRGLNVNLLRMAKERANADRKLRPKKEHTGYVVTSSKRKEYRYKPGRSRNMETVMLWETVMQTPYSVDFTAEQAYEQTYEDLYRSGEGENGPLQRIGITYIFGKRYEYMLGESWFAGEENADNILLNRSLRADYKTGYWEMTFLHTRPLGIVPAEMRAR